MPRSKLVDVTNLDLDPKFLRGWLLVSHSLVLWGYTVRIPLLLSLCPVCAGPSRLTTHTG